MNGSEKNLKNIPPQTWAELLSPLTPLPRAGWRMGENYPWVFKNTLFGKKLPSYPPFLHLSSNWQLQLCFNGNKMLPTSKHAYRPTAISAPPGMGQSAWMRWSTVGGFKYCQTTHIHGYEIEWGETDSWDTLPGRAMCAKQWAGKARAHRHCCREAARAGQRWKRRGNAATTHGQFPKVQLGLAQPMERLIREAVCTSAQRSSPFAAFCFHLNFCHYWYWIEDHCNVLWFH